ncbi:hypothetical protein FZEAL_2132 [Fusarium zealandicum]|uniref:Carboxylic ester hydrolase n=1 Tax=Fusarium zealandicum TaxID=1053134 RepID=A0A8H4XN35_9HYPO|nr:hypothetical protein FZEAL_2132 [Fusarium zealandicum]
MSNQAAAPKSPVLSSDISRHTSDSPVPQATPEQIPKERSKRKRWIIIISAVALLIVTILALTLGLYFGLQKKHGHDDEIKDNEIDIDSDGGEDRHRDSILVDLGYSQYQGKTLDSGINEFLGMRFAQPPVGDLRWRAPIEPESTKDIQSAEEYGAVCPAVGDQLSQDVDEDCLFVNVWAPPVKDSSMTLPVMVYFQPGGYIRNSAPYTNGSQLIETSENNIIVVTFNYRVGLFGFLAGKQVKEDGNLNAGLLDQRMVLQWIQEHISEFGGDPDRVVIQGESAGAGSVALHLVAYRGRDDGLFAGAIAESAFMPGQPKFDDLEYQFERVVNATDCLDAKDKMSCLRGLSSEDLQTHNGKGPFDGRTTNSYFYWAPCTDGDIFEDYPTSLYEKGDFVKVPILFGSCTNEGSKYAANAGSSAQFIRYMQNEYPYLSEDDIETILDLYPREPPVPKHDTWFPSASRAYGEVTFICPAENILNAFADSPSLAKNIWSYRYNVEIKDFAEDGLGVPHVANSPAVFGPNMTPARAGPSYLTYNAPMVPIVMNYWISFVRALDPNKHRYQDTPSWQPWGTEQNRLVFELGNITMELVGNGEKERCKAWLDMADSTKQ